MKPPREPDKEDCCNSGCNPCIFDVYEKQLKLYKNYLENGKVDIYSNGISELNYTRFKVVHNLNKNHSHYIISFQLDDDGPKKRVWWKPGQHFLVKYVANGKSVSRAYTPVKLGNMTSCDFSIIVKRYDKGLVSNYLCDISVGTLSFWRGPYGSYEYVVNKYSRIFMIAQGTGIAPFYSIIDNILSNDEDDTRVILYFTCQSMETILLRQELYELRNFWNFDYRIFVSSGIGKSEGNIKYGEPVTPRKLCYEDITHLIPFADSDQFLICGSSNFMNDYKDYLGAHGPEQNIVCF